MRQVSSLLVQVGFKFVLKIINFWILLKLVSLGKELFAYDWLDHVWLRFCKSDFFLLRLFLRRDGIVNCPLGIIQKKFILVFLLAISAVKNLCRIRIFWFSHSWQQLVGRVTVQNMPFQLACFSLVLLLQFFFNEVVLHPLKQYATTIIIADFWFLFQVFHKLLVKNWVLNLFFWEISWLISF
jgi:hypothetical protein